jgi:hypothetical protein
VLVGPLDLVGLVVLLGLVVSFIKTKYIITTITINNNVPDATPAAIF